MAGSRAPRLGKARLVRLSGDNPLYCPVTVEPGGYTQTAYSPGGGPTGLAAAGLEALSGGVASAILRRLSGLRRR